MIPKKIHFIWLGSALPERYQHFIRSWKDYHPDWEIKIWNDQDGKTFPFRSHDMFFQASSYGLKSDIFRYEILYQYGGIYADTDFLCLKNFESLRQYAFFAGKSLNNGCGVYNGLIGAISQHPLLEKLIDHLTLPQKNNDAEDIFQATGPAYLSDMIYKHLSDQKLGIQLLDKDFFYSLPNSYSQVKGPPWREFITENSYAVHFWDYSWKKSSWLEKVRKFLLAPFPPSWKKFVKQKVFHR